MGRVDLKNYVTKTLKHIAYLFWKETVKKVLNCKRTEPSVSISVTNLIRIENNIKKSINKMHIYMIYPVPIKAFKS